MELENSSYGREPKASNLQATTNPGVNLVGSLSAYHFDGGNFKVIDYSPVDEDLLLANFGVSSDEAAVKMQVLTLVASHTNLTLNLNIMENSYTKLLELALHGKIKLGRITKVEKDQLEWSEIKSYRKQPSQVGKGSIPSQSISSPSEALTIIENVQKEASKARRDLYELGLCDSQIDAILPKTRLLNFAWSISLDDACALIKMIDDESADWEIRSLAMRLKQLVGKLFPVFAMELSK